MSILTEPAIMTESKEPVLTPFTAGEIHVKYMNAPLNDQTKYMALCQLMELRKAVEHDGMIDLNRSACYLTLHSIMDQCDKAPEQRLFNPPSAT